MSYVRYEMASWSILRNYLPHPTNIEVLKTNLYFIKSFAQCYLN